MSPWLLVALWLAAMAAHAQPMMGATPPDGPRLGVVVEQVSFPMLHQLELPYGVEVKGVLPGSPAREAGIQAGDILVKLNDSPVYSPARLRWLVGRAPADGTVTVQLKRDGKMRSVELALAQPEARARLPMPQEPGIARLGIGMTRLTEGLRERYGIAPHSGVLVAEVEAGGPAAAAGIEAGDVLVRIDRRDIRGPVDVLRAVHFFDPGNEVEVELVRDGETLTRMVTLGRAELPEPGMPHGSPRFPLPPWYGERFHGQPPYPYGHPGGVPGEPEAGPSTPQKGDQGPPPAKQPAEDKVAPAKGV